MPYNRPTIEDLAQSAENDLAARLNAFGRLRRNVLNVLARVLAGLVHGLYGFIVWLSKQLVPYTATESYLERHAAWWGIRRKAAAYSRGRAVFTGTPGSKIEAGVILASAEDQKYLVPEAGRLDDAGRAALAVRSLTGGGGADLPVGSILRLISPQSGVKSEARVDEGGLSGGAAVEDDDSLRSRFLDRVQEPPQGGTAHDYRQWALAVPGVTRAWAYGNLLGPGTVGLTFVCDEAADIIPNPEKVAEVQAYIDEPVRKPVTADVIVYAPLAESVDIRIRALTPDTEKVKAAVTAELAALFVREAVPGGRILVSHIREAISLSAGEYDHVLVSPTDNLRPGGGTLIMLGEVIFDQ